MLKKPAKCPLCSFPSELELIYEEVDIGVGVQRHVSGAECPQCGARFACCDHCGAFEFEQHHSWCSELKKRHEIEIEDEEPPV